MISFLKELADWLRATEERERDEYLAQAADHADLDRRIRVWQDRHRTDPKLSPEPH